MESRPQPAKVEHDPASPPPDGAAPPASVVPLHTHDRDVPVQAPGPAVQEPLPLPLSRNERLILRRLARFLLLGGVVYTVLRLLWLAREALIPFAVGLVLAYTLLPLVNRLSERMPRWLAILVVYAITTFGVAVAIAYIVPPLLGQFSSLTSNLPQLMEMALEPDTYFNRLRNYVPSSLQVALDEGIRRSLNTVQNNLTEYVRNLGLFLFSSIGRVFDTITFLIGFLVIPFWLFYILHDPKVGLQAIDKLLPRLIREDFWALARIFDNTFSKYIRGQLLLGLIVGVFAGIGLLVLGLFGFDVNYILLLAIFAGFTELIPVIGPIIGAIPAIILGTFDGLSTALAVTVLYILIQQLENQILVPRIVGQSVGIHPAMMFVLLAVGSQVFGLLGALFAAPTYAAIRDIVVYLDRRLSNPLEPVPVVVPPEEEEEPLRERQLGA